MENNTPSESMNGTVCVQKYILFPGSHHKLQCNKRERPLIVKVFLIKKSGKEVDVLIPCSTHTCSHQDVITRLIFQNFFVISG